MSDGRAVLQLAAENRQLRGALIAARPAIRALSAQPPPDRIP
ncbi:hypothetical protein ACF06L_31450 [Streptomyces sp. NPDC015408]